MNSIRALGAGTIVTVPSGMGGAFDVELIEMKSVGKWRVRVNMKVKDYDGFEFTAPENVMRWPDRKPYEQLEPVTVADIDQ